MKLMEKEKYNELYAEEGKYIRINNDEEEPIYFTFACVPKTVTESNMYDLYIEEEIPIDDEEKEYSESDMEG